MRVTMRGARRRARRSERDLARGERGRRLLLLSLFEQTRSFTSATRRESDIMPLMSALADCAIAVVLLDFFIIRRLPTGFILSA